MAAMLIHIVCWKYRSDVSDAERDEHRARLIALREVIPSLRRLEVGADMLHLDRSFDTGLLAEFDDRAGLDEYSEHPQHVEVAAMGKGLAEKAVSVDFFA